MAHWGVSLPSHILSRITEFKKFQQQKYNRPTNNSNPFKNKQNLFSLAKKRVSSRYLRLQFPISKPKKFLNSHTSINTPLTDNQHNTLEHKAVFFSEIDLTDMQRQVKTERTKVQKLRKCSNVTNTTNESEGQIQVSLLTHSHIRKRTLKQREIGRLRPLFQKDPLLSAKKAIDKMVRDKIEGWQRSSSNSDQQDCNLPLRDPRRV